ncbi:hypothetical protein [Dactylosporangium salmoneum]|uniref:C2H2-type domain-containing protein n=1 Tax=Dactylosporangium salmoneum TaxID=53361 RepID=A0ABN3HDI6_9ACTN
MTVFECARCAAVLTVPVSRVALPVHAHQHYGNGIQLGVLMEPSTYAEDPEPSGPPWRRWDELGPEAAEARGLYAPRYTVSFGPAGAVVVAPGDMRGTVFIQERASGYCCGLSGEDGPNLACARCATPVATRIDDCSLWQAVWLDPHAVRRAPGSAHERPPIDWAALHVERPGVPPSDPEGHASPMWAAAVGAALAHLLAVAGGGPIAVPDGPVANALRRPLDTLLRSPGPTHSLALDGPGLPAVTSGVALVPQHPQTGEVWASAVPAAPLSWDVWRYLAVGPAPAHDDEPPPLVPIAHLEPSWDVFLATLARLPEVRRPWLREIYDRVRTHAYGLGC